MKTKPLKSIVKSLTEMSVSSRFNSSFGVLLDNEIEELHLDLLKGVVDEIDYLPLSDNLST
jgi:hypothetical protein